MTPAEYAAYRVKRARLTIGLLVLFAAFVAGLLFVVV